MVTFSIGQDVATTSNVVFNTMQIGQNSFIISERPDGKAQVDKDWVVLGDIIAENYIVSSSVTHMTTSFSSGSTAFGDSLDDRHDFTGSLGITGSLTLNGSEILAVTDADLYQRKCFVKKANSITIPSTASFSAVTASAPAGLTSTSENDFIFFINGQYMEHDALRIFQKNGSTFELHVDTSSIGYSLEADDEIIAQGKFDS
jgi:hypothetical protein